MAHARRLIVVAALAAGRLAWGAGACEEARDLTGLALAVKDGLLTVVAVDDGTAAAASGVRPDDVVLQVNDVVPNTCSEYARAVKNAAGGRKALLLLVRRADAEVPLALGSRTWGAVPEGEGVAAAPAPSAPPRPRAPEAPPPLPPDTPVSVDSTMAELSGLLGATRQGLASYRDDVTHARRAVETLALRKAATDDAVTALRRVARLHEAAVLAWDAIDEVRKRNGISGRMPISEAMTAPYFSGSPEEAAIDEFEFLREAVAAEPHGGRFSESSGEWRPALARRLLWEHAGEALGGAAATLAGTP